MSQCAKCDKEATYFSPEEFCDQHWAEWWVDGMGIVDPIERQTELDDVLGKIRLLNDQK